MEDAGMLKNPFSGSGRRFLFLRCRAKEQSESFCKKKLYERPAGVNIFFPLLAHYNRRDRPRGGYFFLDCCFLMC